MPTQGAPSSMSVPNFTRIALFLQKLLRSQTLLGCPKFRNWVTWPRPHPLGGPLFIPCAGGIRPPSP